MGALVVTVRAFLFILQKFRWACPVGSVYIELECNPFPKLDENDVLSAKS
jgi:hypothetical protein